MVVYEAYGFTIQSEIALPQLNQRVEDINQFDIAVKIDSYLGSKFKGRPFDFVVDGLTVTVTIPEVGVFRIQDGREIIVSPYEGTDEDIIRLYLLGSCFGALLLQRGIYPLHGSAIAINGKAYAFVGDSGAGKSTLASAFMEKGYPLLSDDVIAVSFDGKSNLPWVTPSYPQQKLWQQSLDAFGVSNIDLQPIYGRENKFCIPVVERFCSTPLPLAGIFELKKSNENTTSIQPIQGLKQLNKLYKHTYRQFLIPKMNLMEWHFRSSTALTSCLPFYRMTRSTDGFSAYQLVELILNTIQQYE